MSFSTRKPNSLSLENEWQELSSAFDKAIELSPDELQQYLKSLKKEKPALAKELESLLSANEASKSFLASDGSTRKNMIQMVSEVLKPTQSETPFLQLGATIGDFQILSLLGQGAFASVYRARQISLDREIALKVSKNEGREARMMAQLEHDNIVTVFSESANAEGNLRFLCMQYVPGLTLEKVINLISEKGISSGKEFLDLLDLNFKEKVPFDPKEVNRRLEIEKLDYVDLCLLIGAQLAEALSYAHGRGILHLDIKPANILITPYGRPLLTDFNVSLDDTARKNENFAGFGGTPGYMSPEQQDVFYTTNIPAAVALIDLRSDIYSLAKVLERALKESREPLQTERQKAVDYIMGQALNSSRELRYANGHDFSVALKSCLEYSKVLERLPPVSVFFNKAVSHPLLAISLFALFPQILGSLVNITYNATHIINQFSELQSEKFKVLIIVYNLFIYPLGVGLWTWRLKRIEKMCRMEVKEARKIQSVMRLCRKEVLRLPLWSVGLTSLGWLPGIFFFPIGLHLLAGPIELSTAGHFAVSFLISWLIALSYSFLNTQYLCLRMLYPKFLVGCEKLSDVTHQELNRSGSKSKLFHILIAVTPLLAASLMLMSGPVSYDISGYSALKTVVLLTICLGVIGLFSALTSLRALYRVIDALNGSHLENSKVRK